MTTTTRGDLRVETRPTQTDAQLMLQLAQLGQTPLMERGQALLWKARETGGMSWEEFQQLGVESEDHAAVMAVLKWHETIGTLVKQGLLDRGLVLDWLWVSGTWDLCKDVALGQRAELGVPQMWENFEALAALQQD
ncbi:MAG: hypothetical protein EPN99_03845 [Frankiales bacterium]|nr:MAG: hypothetical protein EPN99_03845 [Frankiales bacterium]